MIGAVVGRTSKVAFVRLPGDRLAAIHGASVPAFPFSWVASRWRDLRLEPGMSVELDDRHIASRFATVTARHVVPGAIRRAPGGGRRLASALGTISASDAAREACSALEAGFRSGTAGDAVQRVIGRGPGLTPSGDDVIVGLLAGFAILGDEAGSTALRSGLGRLRATLEARTTTVSAAVLQSALDGAFAPVLADIATHADGEPRQVSGAIERLSVIGATSGLDMLAGLGLAIRIGGALYQ